MELVSWSLNATDRIFSTRSSGLGEPICPEGTFLDGYAMDSWENWRDLYILGTMITGYLLIGLGIALVYRKIGKTVTAVQNPVKLPDMIDGVGRAVSAQTAIMNRNMENMDRAISAQTAIMNRNMENMDRAISAQTVVINRNMGIILEKLSALQRPMDRFENQ